MPPRANHVGQRLSVRALLASQLRLHPDGEEALRPNPKTPNLLARIDHSDPWDQCAIQWFCSDATFQSSALVWMGTGPVDPGGVCCETTSWI